MKYLRRIIDDEIDKKAKAFDAIYIVGPKGCGKIRTASERSKTVIEFQDEERREGYILAAENSPSLLLEGDKPILFDEWQDAPKIWGAVRNACDKTDHVGEYYLTGSTSKKVVTPHTGTGRITTIEMVPMSLFESGESNGTISLKELIKNPCLDLSGKKSNLDIKSLIFAACRGGFPRAVLLKDREASLEIAKDYYFQIFDKDISALDGIKRNPVTAKAILRSYARIWQPW